MLVCVTHCPNISSIYSETNVNFVISQYLHPQIHLWQIMQTLQLLLQFHSYFATNIRLSGQCFIQILKINYTEIPLHKQITLNSTDHIWEDNLRNKTISSWFFYFTDKKFYVQNEYKLLKHEYNLTTSTMVKQKTSAKPYASSHTALAVLSNSETFIPHYRSSFYTHKVCTL